MASQSRLDPSERLVKPLTARFDEALVMASSLHRLQARKTSGVPYISHLLAVTSLVLSNGGDEDVAIAALLHDAAEDQGGEDTLAEIEKKFGPNVARWVRQSSDTFEIPKPDWDTRKRNHLAEIPHADPEARLIMLADKVHNVRSIFADYLRVGPSVWNRFRVPRERTMWYYESLLVAFRPEDNRVLYQLLREGVARLRDLPA